MKYIWYGALLLGAGGILWGGYYFISPFFIHTKIDDAVPVETTSRTVDTQIQNTLPIAVPSTPPQKEVPIQTETKSQTQAPTPTPLPVAKPKEAEAVPVIGTPGHKASGTARLLNTTQGDVVRYENFSTINGPDLFVYLATDLKATEFVSLGELKATEGNINYVVPLGTDTKKYPYVLVWCKQFGVLFNSAKIN